AEEERGPSRGRRGDGQHRARRRPHPRRGDAKDDRVDRGRRVPQDAELLAAPRPARPRGSGRGGGRVQRSQQPPRLRDGGAAGAQASPRRREGRGGSPGRGRGGGGGARGAGGCLERDRRGSPRRFDGEMKKAVAAAALLAVLACAGGASGRTFTVVPAGSATLPSAETPNAPGSIHAPFPPSVAAPQPARPSSRQSL